MNIFWEEGLVDIDSFSQSSTDFKAKAAAGRYASFSSNSALMVTEEDIHDCEMLTPLVSDMYSEPLDFNNGGFTPGHSVITTASKHPEAAMRLLDWMYTKEGMLSMNYGPNNWVVLDNGAHAFILADGTHGVYHAYRSTLTMGYGVGIPMNAHATEESFIAYVSDEENNYLNSITYAQIVVHALPFTHNPTPSVIMTAEEKENSISLGDLKKYVSQMEAKFITRELDIDSQWDSYVKQCEAMDLEQLQMTYEAAYGRFLSNVSAE